MITIDLQGPEGNVFSLMGLASVLLKNKFHSQVFIDEVINDMKSKDYNHALSVFESHLKSDVTFLNDPRNKKTN
jgi:hypothetical protein